MIKTVILFFLLFLSCSSYKIIEINIDENLTDNIFMLGYKAVVLSDGSTESLMSLKNFDENRNDLSAVWNKLNKIGERSEIESITTDKHGNVYVLLKVYNLSSYSETVFIIKKYDAKGNEYKTWNLLFNKGKTNPYKIIADNNNNVYLISYISKNPAYLVDLHIRRFDSDGIEDSVNWDKIFFTDIELPCIYFDYENTLYITTQSHSVSSIFYDLSIKKITNCKQNNILNLKNMNLNGFVINDSNEIIISGINFDDSNNPNLVWIKKYDNNGVLLSTVYEMNYSNSCCWYSSFDVDKKNNLIALCHSQNGEIHKFNIQNEITQKIVIDIPKFPLDTSSSSGNYNFEYYLNDIKLDTKGNIYVLGGRWDGTTEEGWMTKYSSDGYEDIFWKQLFNDFNSFSLIISSY